MDTRPIESNSPHISLSLVIPAFNEGAGIRQAIVEADEALARLTRDYEILVVDDGSHDATAALVADEAEHRPHVRLLRHETNRGYGAALRTGFEAARFDHVAFTDADCQFDLTDLPSLFRLADRYPLVVGYRIQRQDSWLRCFYSWGYNGLVRTLFGTRVRDCDCALKVFRKDVLAELLPESRGFFVNAEILTRARQRGYDVAEVGVRHRPRLHGDSKVSLLDVPRTLRTLLPFWWSRVLFPQDATTVRRSEHPEPAFLLTLILVLVAGLLFFSRLTCPLQEPQEARYAEIPRQMLAEGDWLVPVLHGQPYLDKPPLLYWLVMANYKLFGVHDWAARLVSCTASFLMVLVTFGWGKRVMGVRAAFAGALVLCLSARFIQLGRLLTMDSLLGLWIIAALATAHVACRGPGLRWRWWLLSASACGLGLLTKGPVALALVVVPVLAYQLLDIRAARPRWSVWGAYLAVAIGLAGPWYLLVALHDPSYLDYFFWNQNVVRYVASFDHEEPVWFYLPGLLLGMLPWTLLAPSLVRFLGRRSAGVAANRPAALGFFLLAFGWCLLFFSAAGCKRASYVLPAMPLLALALGCYLDRLLPHTRLSQVSAFLAPSPTFLAQRATLLVLSLGAGVSLLAVITGIWQPFNGLVLAGVAVAGFWIVFSRNRQRTRTSWALCGAVTFALLLVGVHQLLPSYARRFSMRGQIRPHVELCRDPQVPVLCYPRRWDSVSFYLNRDDVRVYTPGLRSHLIADLHTRPESLVFVKSDHSYKDLLRDLPAALEFVPQGRRGNVTVGLVRHRREAPPGVLAERKESLDRDEH